jgi:NTE family protein
MTSEHPATEGRENGRTGSARRHRPTALVLPGGGARAAYQVGFLRYVAREFPEARFDIVFGVSAGAINAAFLAAHRGTFREAVADLADVWRGLTAGDVFRVDTYALLRDAWRWAMRLVSGGVPTAPQPRGLVDTAPLRRLLVRTLGAADDGTIPGVAENLAEGRLRALAVTTSSYQTGESVTWFQGDPALAWTRQHRRGASTALTVDHVAASAALPFLFPPVRLADGWYGDGGVRLAAPLSPAIHLGADRILAITTGRTGTAAPEDSARHPPPARIAGVLLESVFLDLLDQDAARIEKANRLLPLIPREHREGMRRIDLTVQRPAADLGTLASRHEFELPRLLRWMARGWGTRQVRSNDALSLLLFQHGYLDLLIGLGESDAASRHAELAAFFRKPRAPIVAPRRRNRLRGSR